MRINFGQGVSVPSGNSCCEWLSSEKSRGCPSWLAGPPVAVGMNIDIASIDMVSEVNMVSINVHSYASAILNLGAGKCRRWGCGVLGYMYSMGTRDTVFCPGIHGICSYRPTHSGTLHFFQFGSNIVSQHRVSKAHHTFTCVRQQYAGGPLQDLWFWQLLGSLSLSTDKLLVWGSVMGKGGCECDRKFTRGYIL